MKEALFVLVNVIDKCHDGVIIEDYAAKQLGGLFQELPFQSVHLKWVYSGCFPPGHQATSRLNRKERNREKRQTPPSLRATDSVKHTGAAIRWPG